MTDSEKKNHWQFLASLLGAKSSEESEPEAGVDESRPAAENEAKKEAKAPPQKKKPRLQRNDESPQKKQQHWGDVHKTLGLEIPEADNQVQPEPVGEAPAQSDAPQTIVEGSATDPLSAIFDEESEDDKSDELVPGWGETLNKESVFAADDEDPQQDLVDDVSFDDEVEETEDVEEIEEPKRRRRGGRRRRRRGRGEKSESSKTQHQVEDRDLDDVLDVPFEDEIDRNINDEAGEDSPSRSAEESTEGDGGRRRKRRRRRREVPEDRNEQNELSDDREDVRSERSQRPRRATRTEEDRKDDVRDSDDREPKRRKTRRNIPSWHEAIEGIISTNIGNRQKSRGGQRGRRRRRD